jgi:hypothetical protein
MIFIWGEYTYEKLIEREVEIREAVIERCFTVKLCLYIYMK